MRQIGVAMLWLVNPDRRLQSKIGESYSTFLLPWCRIMHLFVTGHVRPHYPASRLDKAQGYLAHACSSRLTNSEYILLLLLPTSAQYGRGGVLESVILSGELMARFVLSQVMCARTIPLRGRIKRKAILRMHVLVGKQKENIFDFYFYLLLLKCSILVTVSA
uniref:AlNc14C304G10421 protein n=1 Tax=Albugo laibachii Nc14 TaxID=890382 RepID=F0WVW1_9STRA|nr:AlNc14C304G10421 [Albugo laibachii Nc14]|eukprot:CCA25561.1 AlNc14C304G10421 [Albugo laibachii Nc14]